MKARRLFRRWQRRSIQWLVDAMDLLRHCQTQGEAEPIHQLRVSLRRLRLMLRLGAHHLGARHVAGFRAWARQTSTTIGTLRDLDVTLDWLRLQSDCDPVIRRVEFRRSRAWKACRTRLARWPGKTAARLAHGKLTRKSAAALAQLYRATFQQHSEQVRRGVDKFFELKTTARHAYRRTIRRLRYLRELGLSHGQQRPDRLLKQLVRLQEALGEHQNRVVAQIVLARLGTAPPRQRLRRKLTAEAAHCEVRIRRELRALGRLQGWKATAASTARPPAAATAMPPGSTSGPSSAPR